MSQQELNKQIVSRYVQAFNDGDTAALRAVFAPDAMIQGVLGMVAIEKALPIWQQLHAAFAAELHVESMIAEGDEVAVRYTERGRFRGPFREQQPTGKSYELVAMEWFVLRDGLIVKRFGARDSASQARQIGLS